MKTLGSAASVLAAMREDAGAEIERIEQESRAQVAALEAQGRGEIEAPDREEKLAAAAREARETLAREDWADARAALEARERWMERAAAAGQELLATLATPGERRATLARLAREALERIGEGRCTLHVSERDQPLLDPALQGELRVTAGAPAPISGGCIVRSSQGPLSVDNSFEERARRFEPQLRTALGKVYAP